MAFSWPYREHSHTPYWGPTTSQANFCEEDYIVTPYIAELINTITNLTYLCYAIHGIRANSNHKDAFLRNLPYLGISLVGIFSAIFHASLKHYTQWCDELSMLIATSTVLHRVFTFDKSLSITVHYGLAMTAFMATFIAWHCWMGETTMHSILFGIMIAIVGTKTRSIISARVPDKAIRQQVKKLATWGGIIFVSGFAVWIIDNEICSSLTVFKRKIGMPWSFIFELHGWWHILTGLGAYIFIALVEYLTSEDAGNPLGSRFAWPVGLLINGQAEMEENVASFEAVHSNGNGKIEANGNGEATCKSNGSVEKCL